MQEPRSFSADILECDHLLLMTFLLIVFVLLIGLLRGLTHINGNSLSIHDYPL
jgi:hypothetical protein